MGLCRVGQNKTKAAPSQSVEHGAPPKPDQTEVARKLVNHQGQVVEGIQHQLAVLLKGKNVDPAVERKVRSKLEHATKIMQKAQAHLKKLEANKAEMYAQTLMKDAKVLMDALILKLRRSQKQDPP